MKVLVTGRGEQRLAPYLAALHAAGVDAVGVEPGDAADLAGVGGLVLTGGDDIDPKRYGQDPDPLLGEMDTARDAFELELLAEADRAELPILAICRGLQLLNVHRGGTLIQHLAESERHRKKGPNAGEPVHPVVVEAGSRLASILGAGEVMVNSRHHQAVDQLGSGLVVSARDPEDGVVEGVEDPTRRFLVGVQWHPEDQAPMDEVQRRLFAAFGGAV